MWANESSSPLVLHRYQIVTKYIKNNIKNVVNFIHDNFIKMGLIQIDFAVMSY